MFGRGKTHAVHDWSLCLRRRRNGEDDRAQGCGEAIKARESTLNGNHRKPATLSTVLTTSASLAAPMISSASLMTIFGTPFTV